jgi:hypothetical protein
MRSRDLLLASLFGLAACGDASKREAPASSAAALAPSAPVDRAFAGCSAWGKKPAAGTVARPQPGVGVGDATFCAVSGAAFVVEATGPKKTIGKTTYHFCCEGCLAYFEQRSAEVLRVRGWQ